MSFLGTPGEDIFENFGTWAVLSSFSCFTSVKSAPLNAQNDPSIPQWTPKVTKMMHMCPQIDDFNAILA